ncbi:hypothetical protein HY357_04850 [Candidatus Roizmanbacteria bacterium]|nr:hypothetical protein [Candidatus Roizmanbacteria bacterium]
MRNFFILTLGLLIVFSNPTSVFAQHTRISFIDMLKVKFMHFRNDMVNIIGGTVTSVGKDTFTIEKEGKKYTVTQDKKTNFRRHFWGKSFPEELAIGNKVNVYGSFTDPEHTTIKAHLVRNLSIMKRFAIFEGEVVEKYSDLFVLKTKKRDNQTIYISSSTKFVNKLNKTISYNDVQIDHRVGVRGTWDKSQNKVTEVVEVKDFSL